MKKVYLLIVMLLVTSVTFAQMFQVGTQSSKKYTHELVTAKTPTDTAGFSVNFLPQFAVGTQVITYTDLSGGYVYGVNGNAFKAVAQGYTMINPGNMGIEGVIAWFCGETSVSNDATSKLTFSVFNKPDSLPTTQIGTTSVDLLFSACDTNFLAFNCVSFPSVIGISGDFTIVCSLLNIKTDTIGFLSDQDGEGAGYTALKYNTTWMTYRKAYGLNTNISLFAVVDANYIGIDGSAFFQGSKMTINQNPTRNNLSISYAVEKDAKVNFELLSMSGKVVYKQDEGTRIAGNVYSINADISNLATGTYLCSLNTNGQRLIKKVVVE
jgi:hypothetical protein